MQAVVKLAAAISLLAYPVYAQGIISPGGGTTQNPSVIYDSNSASYQGAVAMTVGGTARTTAVRAVAAACTAAGTVTLAMADGTSLSWPVVVGFQFQPFAALQISASTATCTYQGLN